MLKKRKTDHGKALDLLPTPVLSFQFIIMPIYERLSRKSRVPGQRPADSVLGKLQNTIYGTNNRVMRT